MSGFKKYTSVPCEVEAVRFTKQNKDQLFNDMPGNRAADFENGEPILKVTTMHGEIAVIRIGDWIVKDKTPGTYYPVKHDVFIEKYV